jgi:hypothetical protein
MFVAQPYAGGGKLFLVGSPREQLPGGMAQREGRLFISSVSRVPLEPNGHGDIS